MIDLIGNKLLPQNIEAEKNVLSSLLISPEIYIKIAEILQANDFYNEAHKKIYEVISEMLSKDLNIDIVTICDELNKRNELENCGGALYISEIHNTGFSYAYLENAIIVKSDSLKRSQIVRAGFLLQEAYNPQSDIYELLESEQSGLNNDYQSITQSNLMHISELGLKTFDFIQKMQSGEIKPIPTANNLINYFLEGGYSAMNPMNYIVARPGEGKTSAMINDVVHAAKLGFNVGIYSLEQKDIALNIRMIANLMDIDPSEMKSQKENIYKPIMQKLTHGFSKVKELGIWINDKSGWHINKLVLDIPNAIKKFKLDCIYFDYLQLINGQGGTVKNRENEITYICNKFQALSKKINIPLIILAQLNRDAENKRPTLANIRESGGIENSADVVIALFTDKKLEANIEIQKKDLAEKKNSYRVILEKIVLKNRDGKTGFEKVNYEKKYYKMTSIESEEPTYQEPPKETERKYLDEPINLDKFSESKEVPF